MRWFKHFSDNHRGRSIQFLFDKYEHKALSYYILLELCADKLEKNKDEIITESDCVFYFHERTLTNNLRLNRKTLGNILGSCQELSLFSVEISEKEYKISMPMLLNLLEKNFKKRPKKVLLKSFQTPLDKDLDKDVDTDKDVDIKKASKLQNSKIWDSYFNAYRLRYGIDPVRNAQVNSQVSKLREKLGVEESCLVVEFFLKHNDSWYLKNTHSFGDCLKNAESLRTQMLRGKPITLSDARKGEQQIKHIENMNDAKKGGF